MHVLGVVRTQQSCEKFAEHSSVDDVGVVQTDLVEQSQQLVLALYVPFWPHHDS